MVRGVTRLGYQIPNFTYPDTDSSTLLDAIVRQAVEADNSGFDTVMVMDHFYQLRTVGGVPQDHHRHAARRTANRGRHLVPRS